MNCDRCDQNKELLDSLQDKNQRMMLQIVDKDETIRKLQAEVQTIGAKYRDMFWQRNTLHEIVMSEPDTIRYRQLTNE